MKRLQILISVLFFLLPVISNGQTINFSADKTQVCVGETVQFTDNSTGTITSWSWDFGDGNTSTDQNPSNIYTASGSYDVSLSVNNGPAIETRLSYITVLETPVAIFDTILNSTNRNSWFYIGFNADTVTISPFDSLMYSWDFGDGTFLHDTLINSINPLRYSSSPFHLYDVAGNYNVNFWVKYENGCTNSITSTITVTDRDSLFLPNVFTPNNDGINDNFTVGSNGIDDFSITIYSRWGNIIYKGEPAKQVVWDGRTVDGSLVQPGTYFYVVVQESGTKDYPPKKGFVHIFYQR